MNCPGSAHRRACKCPGSDRLGMMSAHLWCDEADASNHDRKTGGGLVRSRGGVETPGWC